MNRWMPRLPRQTMPRPEWPLVALALLLAAGCSEKKAGEAEGRAAGNPDRAIADVEAARADAARPAPAPDQPRG